MERQQLQTPNPEHEQVAWYKLLNEIITILSTADEDQMYTEVLDLLQERFDSRYGYFGYIDEDGNLVCPSMNTDIREQCRMEHKSIVFPYHSWGGIWGQSLIDGEARFSNDGLSTPEDHIPLTRAVAVPIVFKKRVIGQIVLADKPEDYRQEEIVMLNAIAEVIAPVLDARIKKERAIKREKEARERAEEANELKSTFLASMSHEIRTPLNAILGFHDIIMDNVRLDNEYRFYLEQAKSSGYILLQLINDILDFSKIESDKLRIQNTPYSLSGALKNVYSIARMTLDRSDKDVALKTNFPPNIDVFLIGDPHRLEQILINLLTNAIKFTDEGFIEYGLSFDDKKEIRFYVRDTGVGIPEDKQNIIFEAFRQAEEKVVAKHGGSGLGLAISKRLVEMMGGTISLQSTPGEGTVFTFTIPYVEAPKQKEESTTEPTTDNKTARTILVVEDNRINRLVIKKILEKRGDTILLANDGEEAIIQIKNNPDIELVLMDMYMPKMDGIVATRAIRAYEEQNGRPRVPIIALTAAGTDEEKRKMEEAGSDGFHSKPIDKIKLTEQIRYYLQ